MKQDVEIMLNGHLLKRLFDLKFEAVREKYQLRQIELDILELVSGQKERTEKEIVQVRCVSKAHVSKSIENLREKGFVSVREAPDDRRQIFLCATQKGLDAAGAVSRIREQITDVLYEGVSDEERAAFYRVLHKMEGNVNHCLSRGSHKTGG